MRKTVGSLILLGLLGGIILIASLSQADELSPVTLTWERGTDAAVKHYEVYRAEVVGEALPAMKDFKMVGTPKKTTYEDEVDKSKSWAWYVLSVWENGDKSGESEIVYLRVDQSANPE